MFQWRKAYTEGSLVAVGANEPVVPASELQEAMRRIKQFEAALGRKTLENEILKEAVDFAKSKNGLRARRCSPRKTIRTVCSTLGVARSDLVAMHDRPADWIDRRTARSRRDDGPVLDDIDQVVRDQATYGYRRVWAVLRYQ